MAEKPALTCCGVTRRWGLDTFVCRRERGHTGKHVDSRKSVSIGFERLTREGAEDG
jgi:hypothetical protein